MDGEVARIRERDTTRLLAARARDKVTTVVCKGDEHILMLARQAQGSQNFEGIHMYYLEFYELLENRLKTINLTSVGFKHQQNRSKALRGSLASSIPFDGSSKISCNSPSSVTGRPVKFTRRSNDVAADIN
jgi:hypothetical protein